MISSTRPGACHATAVATMLLLAAGSLAAQWSELPSIGVDRASPGLAYLDGTLYLFGGFSAYAHDGALTSAQALDLATGAWKPIADMPEPRANGYAAAVDGRIYLMGGTQGPELALQVLRYDPATDDYTRLTPMPVPGLSFAGAVVGHTIYVIGGIPANGSRASPTSAVYAYDVTTDAWKRLADLPYATSNFTATSIGRSIFVMGGSVVKPPLVNQRDAYRGDLADDGSIAWHRIADLPDSLTYLTSGAAKGKVIVAGGINQDGRPTHAVYSYDPSADRWSRSYPLPIDASSASVSMPGDGTSIYYAGGIVQRRAFRFDGGDPHPILALDQNDFFATARTGATTTLAVKIINHGIVPLGGSLDIPDGITWLAPVHPPFDNIPPLSEGTILLTAGDPALAAGDYVTTAILKSSDPAHPETLLRLHLFVRDSLPLQAMPLVVEEGTGNWNGWEPDARARIDSIRTRHPGSTIVLAYHGPAESSEPMWASGVDETITGLGLVTYPSISMGRVAAPGEELPMMADRSRWVAEADRRIALRPNAPVRIDVDGLDYAPGERSIVAQVHVTTTNALLIDSSVSYRVTAIITEDSISYPQKHYLPGAGGSVTTEQIDPYLHNDVVRTIWPDATGRELPPPEEAIHDGRIDPGVRLDQEVIAPVRSSANPQRTALVLLVHVMRHGRLAEILGIWRRQLEDLPSGVDIDAMVADRTMRIDAAPNPVSESLGVTYALPRRGRVAIELFSAAGTRIETIDVGMMEPGEHATAIDVSWLPTGAYLLRISADGATASKLVTVVR